MRKTEHGAVKVLFGEFVRYDNNSMSLSNLDINLNIDSVKAVYSPRLMPDVWHEYECTHTGETFREWFQHEILNNRYIVLRQVYKREKESMKDVEFDMNGKKYRITEVQG